MPRFKDQAIVLRELEWSETSQIVVLLTAAHGKVRGLAKGSKRQSPSHTQRFSGGIELLTRGQVIATTRRTAELATITEWDQQQDCHHLWADLTAQWLAMYAAELTGAMLADLDPHPRLFTSLSAFLDGLACDRPQAALLMYQWTLLDDCGYRPELDRDVGDGGTLAEASAYTFDAQAGGFTRQAGPSDWRVRAGTVALLRHLAAGQSTDDAADDALLRANRLLAVYAQTIVGRELNTMSAVMGESRHAEAGLRK